MSTKSLLNHLNQYTMETQYEDPRWINFIRDVVGARLTSNLVSMQSVQKIDAIRFEGDFFGYLRYRGYGYIGHWVHLTINGMQHPTQFGPHIEALTLIPDERLEELYQAFSEADYKMDKKIKELGIKQI